MDSELFKLMATQRAFAILFSYLLFYVLKDDVEDIKEKLNKK
ncbi:BhlA/UviB family holin-like peptide [Clostridium perfringens]